MGKDHFKSHPRTVDAPDWNFNIIFDDQTQIAEMAKSYLPYLDHPGLYPPIPVEWLHMTILRVGYVTEFSDQEMAAVASHLATDLAKLRLPELQMGNPWLWPGSGNPVMLISPERPLSEVFEAVMAAMRKVTSTRAPTRKLFIPHVALAYNRDYDDEKGLKRQLDAHSIPAVSFRANKLSLIKQQQTPPFYQWEVIQNLPIGQA